MQNVIYCIFGKSILRPLQLKPRDAGEQINIISENTSYNNFIINADIHKQILQYLLTYLPNKGKILLIGKNRLKLEEIYMKKNENPTDTMKKDSEITDFVIGEDDDISDWETEQEEALQMAEESVEPIKSKAEYLEKLLNTYRKLFEMEEIADSENGLVAKAHYMERTENGRFAFMKAERHEYVYIFDMEQLTHAAFAEAADYSLQDGLEKIQPTKSHLASFITVVILADSIDNDGKTLVNKHRYVKNLKRQRKGYVNQRICAIDFSDGQVFCNKDSKPLGEFLQKFFNA